MEFEKLQDIIADVMNIEDKDIITMDSTFVDDLGADSLDIFQIIMGIEETFDIEIDNEEAEKIATVGDAAEQIRNATNDQAWFWCEKALKGFFLLEDLFTLVFPNIQKGLE